MTKPKGKGKRQRQDRPKRRAHETGPRWSRVRVLQQMNAMRCAQDVLEERKFLDAHTQDKGQCRQEGRCWKVARRG